MNKINKTIFDELLNIIEPHINHELNGIDYFGTVTLKCKPQKFVTLKDLCEEDTHFSDYKIKRFESITCDVSSKTSFYQLMTSIRHFDKEPKKDVFIFETLELYLTNLINVIIGGSNITINSYDYELDVINKIEGVAKIHDIPVYCPF
jgi:hypothetical protein